MKGKIKILSLLLALAMVASMFFACNTTGGGKKAAEDLTKEGKITWYHWGAEPKNAKPVEDALNAKSKADIKTTVDFKWATGNDQRVKTMMATGGEFDIAFTCNWYANYVLAAQQNQLADITAELENFKELKNAIPQNVWDGAKVNGKIYAVPTLKDTAATHYWFVNSDFVFGIDGAKELFEKTGATLDTVTPLLRKIKEAGKTYPNELTAPFNFNWAGLQGHDSGWDMIGHSIRVGVKIDGNNTKVQSLYEDADYINVIKELQTWHKEGLSNKDAVQTELEPNYVVVSTAQGFEGAEAYAWGGATKGYAAAINKKMGPFLTTSSVQGSMNGISPNSKNIKRSLKYLEYINTNKDYRNILAFGIKDTNWKFVEEGKTIEILNDDWAPGTFSQAKTLLMYAVAPAPADMYDKMATANETATNSPLLGFNPDLKKVETQMAGCANVIENYYKQIQTGTIDGDVEAYLQKALTELRAAGLDDVIKEMQTQVDAYVKK